MKPRLLWLPPLVVYSLDIALTLAGQSPAYWAGDHSATVEANPLAYRLLEISPWLFLGLAVGWAAGFLAVIAFGGVRPARVVAYLVTVGHTFGAASWLIKLGWPGIAAAVVLALVVGRALHARTDVCSEQNRTVQ